MSILMTWVVGAYRGERAKSVLAHANEGIGYKIMEQRGSGVNLEVLAAFRTVSGDIPEHLTEIVDPIKVAKLEEQMTTHK